jgi:hypothetical protein
MFNQHGIIASKKQWPLKFLVESACNAREMVLFKAVKVILVEKNI